MLDFALDERLFIFSEIDAAAQEIDILFNTDYTELLGNTQFGTNFEQFLWEMEPNERQVQNYIYEQLRFTSYAKKYITDVFVTYVDGTERAIYYIEIHFQDEVGNKRLRKYQYS